MSTEKNISKPTITSKTAAHGGKHGKAEEAPKNPVSGQRRMVASDEEKKEREMRAARARGHGEHGVHGGSGAHEGHGAHGGHHNEEHH